TRCITAFSSFHAPSKQPVEQLDRRCLLAVTEENAMCSNGTWCVLTILVCSIALGASAQAQNTRTTSAASYLERGNQSFARDELDRAIADYDLAIAFEPGAPVYYNRALAKERKGDIDGALADYERSIELNPRYAGAHRNRGNILYARGNHNEAIRSFTEAIKLTPRDPGAWNNRGMARHVTGDLENAIADFDRAISLNPRGASFYSNRAIARLCKDEPELALSDLNRAIALDRTLTKAWVLRGVVWRAKNNLARAI